MEEIAKSTINDTIWITSRVRIIAERKALRNQNVSFLAVTYYSLFSVILSIFGDFYSKPYPALDKINLSSSVIVLVASLVAAGFRLEARASAFRECYLKLQSLHDEDLADQEKKKKYREIMMDFPNHAPNDYADLLINHLLLEGKTLTNGGEKLKYTGLMAFSFFLRATIYWGLLAILFLGPVAFLLLPLFCGSLLS
ncbi:SLATT domain-containing protein [Agrobacterium genomosp. 13]|uniref:SMODS and SLOG-associating 2TM effector domain-containing protein n=1 Tax=Agrobacterium genomosp. 13 str. CFBP 6927 TaxID=1183428 RepID=A0ABP2BKI0_9HYPH|nr:SLATT domain-containing protein [Agrobacterium genomosp. 13]CUX43763.1 conserved membrane hypothetical protein [Agrobacterium genomosp. 13 str. CFBP 6927]